MSCVYEGSGHRGHSEGFFSLKSIHHEFSVTIFDEKYLKTGIPNHWGELLLTIGWNPLKTYPNKKTSDFAFVASNG